MNDRNGGQKLVVVLAASLCSKEQTIRLLKELVSQTLVPDKVFACLLGDGLSKEAVNLSDDLMASTETETVEILWCKDELDIQSCCLSVFSRYREDVVVTLGSESLLDCHSLEKLWDSYLKYPTCVSCSRAALITCDADGVPLPSSSWLDRYVTRPGEPSRQLYPLPSGITLYPPEAFPPEALDAKVAHGVCPGIVDLWLNVWEMYLGIPIVLNTDCEPGFSVLLQHTDFTGGLLDLRIATIREWFERSMGVDPFVIECDGATGTEAMERTLRLAAEDQRGICLIARRYHFQMTERIQRVQKERDKLVSRLDKQIEESDKQRKENAKLQKELMHKKERIDTLLEENAKLNNKLAHEKDLRMRMRDSLAYKTGTFLAKPVRVARKLFKSLKGRD